MVTKSTVDFEGWKLDVKNYYLEKFPKHKKEVLEFINYLDKSYESNRRSYFSYKLMWFLYHRKRSIKKNNQHLWIAFIGKRGGEGKSTLAKQTLHFLDNTFNTDERTALDYEKFLTIAYKTKVVDKNEMPAILMDETDPAVHILSKKGRELRKIITKIRQLNLFVGVCANSLNDVPDFIYDRLTTIVFINQNHRYWLWDSQNDGLKESIITDIKEQWKKYKHGAFVKRYIQARAYFKNQSFSKELPFIENDYDSKKEQDLLQDIESHLGIKKPAQEIPIKEDNESLVQRLKHNNPDLTDGQIAKALGLTRQWVNKLKNRVQTEHPGLN